MQRLWVRTVFERWPGHFPTSSASPGSPDRTFNRRTHSRAAGPAYYGRAIMALSLRPRTQGQKALLLRQRWPHCAQRPGDRVQGFRSLHRGTEGILLRELAHFPLSLTFLFLTLSKQKSGPLAKKSKILLRNHMFKFGPFRFRNGIHHLEY
jgi:hypothetical protein